MTVKSLPVKVLLKTPSRTSGGWWRRKTSPSSSPHVTLLKRDNRSVINFGHLTILTSKPIGRLACNRLTFKSKLVKWYKLHHISSSASSLFLMVILAFPNAKLDSYTTQAGQITASPAISHCSPSSRCGRSSLTCCMHRMPRSALSFTAALESAEPAPLLALHIWSLRCGHRRIKGSRTLLSLYSRPWEGWENNATTSFKWRANTNSYMISWMDTWRWQTFDENLKIDKWNKWYFWLSCTFWRIEIT